MIKKYKLFHDILIVDDENLARHRLQTMLESYFPNATYRHARNGIEALELISRKPPELLFLDVQMPGLSGIDVARQISADTFPIIFQTAFDSFAIDAFDVSACDYLLKPFTADRLLRSLERAGNLVDSRLYLENLSKHYSSAGRPVENLSVSSGNEIRVINPKNLACFVSKNHYTCLMINGKEFTSSLSLDKLETILDQSIFLRVHRNAIINYNFFSSLVRGERDQIVLSNGETVEVSRRRLQALKERLNLR